MTPLGTDWKDFLTHYIPQIKIQHKSGEHLGFDWQSVFNDVFELREFDQVAITLRNGSTTYDRLETSPHFDFKQMLAYIQWLKCKWLYLYKYDDWLSTYEQEQLREYYEAVCVSTKDFRTFLLIK